MLRNLIKSGEKIMLHSNIYRYIFYVLLAASIAIVCGCTWVKATPEAKKVRLVPADRVADCRRIGAVTTYTKDKISVVGRKHNKVSQELETLAKNDAAKRGADTIVATTKVQDGQQDFALFRCL